MSFSNRYFTKEKSTITKGTLLGNIDLYSLTVHQKLKLEKKGRIESQIEVDGRLDKKWYDGSKFDQVMDFEFDGNMVGKAD